MAFWKIERSSDGFVAVVEADNHQRAVEKFEREYGSDVYVEETDAEEYAAFRRDADNDTPWYS